MALVLLIRHGQNDWVKKNRIAGWTPGIHLNDPGRQEVEALSGRLSHLPIAAIYSSPLERTMETALPIANAHDMKIIPRAGLIETDVGKWQGKKVKKLRKLKKWRKVQLNPSRFQFPKGESIASCQQRLVEEIESLVASHDAEDMIVCVSHADPIKMIVAHYLGLHLDMYQRFSVSPASITSLMIGPFGSHLWSLNYDLSLTLVKH